MSENEKSEQEIARENVNLLKSKIASLLTPQGNTSRPIRDAIFSRVNERLAFLGNKQPNEQPPKQQQEPSQQPQETIRCPNCGRELPEGIKFCPECGFALELTSEEKRLQDLSHMSVEVDR